MFLVFDPRQAEGNIFGMGMAGMVRKDLKCEGIFFFLMNPGERMWKEKSCVVNVIFHKPLGIPLRYPGSHLGNPGWRLKPFY